jgi:hypothetical protein
LKANVYLFLFVEELDDEVVELGDDCNDVDDGDDCNDVDGDEESNVENVGDEDADAILK